VTEAVESTGPVAGRRPAEARGLPIVAVVGRPNVGKSTLFNRLARTKLAIVHDEPGVTRDRHYADTSAFGRGYTLIDTGGFDPESDDPMKAGITGHVKAAIAEADVIVFVTDDNLTQADRAAVALLRGTNKPVIFTANKADTPAKDADAYELYSLGVAKVLPISALHGRGMGDLEAAIIAALPKRDETAEEDDEYLTRIAIVGRPNAGKSSLLNRLLGEDRMLVDDRPGTTRDSIDAVVTRKIDGVDHRYVFIDTAGIRKKGRVTKADDAVEGLSVLQAIRSIERAHVVILMVDAHDGVAEQDAKIMGLAEERGRGMIIALNKNDLLDKDEAKRAEVLARDKISFAPFVPMVRMSAKTGRGVNELMKTVDEVRASFKKRIGTGELNRFFSEVLELRPPPTMGAKAPRIYYVTQAEHSPPKFVMITNAPESMHFSYQRFVINQLRKRFGFEGVPVRVFYKPKRRTDRAERMLARAEATADLKPRQKVNATTRARAKARIVGTDKAKVHRSSGGAGKRGSVEATRAALSENMTTHAPKPKSTTRKPERAGRPPSRAAERADRAPSRGAERSDRASSREKRSEGAPARGKRAEGGPSRGKSAERGPSRGRNPEESQGRAKPTGHLAKGAFRGAEAGTEIRRPPRRTGANGPAKKHGPARNAAKRGGRSKK
jgi:GTP-binding protein